MNNDNKKCIKCESPINLNLDGNFHDEGLSHYKICVHLWVTRPKDKIICQNCGIEQKNYRKNE